MADETPTNEQGIPLENAPTLDQVAEIQAEQRAPLEVSLKEVEVAKLNLQENDVLVVKMKGMDLDYDLIKSLQKHFQKVFPNNKVLVFSLTEDATMDLDVVNAALQEEASNCATAPKGYCDGCDCGKREAAEAAAPAPIGPTRMTKGTLVKAIEAGHAVEGETGSIDTYIGGGYYLVMFQSVGVIKMDGNGLQQI